LMKNPDKASIIDEAKAFLRLFNFNECDVFESKIIALKKRIDFSIDHPELATPSNEKSLTNSKNMRHRVALWLKIAASVSFLLMATFLVKRYDINQPVRAIFSGTQEQTTHKGERTIISLEDGTKIWLNVDSRIRYPETFEGKDSREVYLEGEAFFDVTENKAKPFIVRTEGVRIVVLGTTFNVKSYEKEDQIQTTLIKGKVTIESIEEQPKVVSLAPNQMATYHKESKNIVLNTEKDLETLAGWKDGRLIFVDKPLSEIVIALERWYDIRIKVEDEKSLKCHFSAKVENLSLDEVLELFKASEGIDYTINDRVVTIRGSICRN
ncbi:MAG TPA: FecR domain-containing protein, partial [Chryseosolibacter sp.]